MSEEDVTPTTESAETEAPEAGPLSLLASEKFGADYHPRKREEETQLQAEEEAPEEESEESPEEEAQEAESEEEGESTEDESEGEEEPITSWSELVEHQEWDPEWANSLRIPVKVDGEPSEVPISDLVANYQMDQAAEKRLEDAKSKAKSITEEAAHKSQAIEESYATAAKLIEKAEKLIDDDAAGIDWKELRENDPAEYSAKKAEMQERREAIEKMKREAVEEYQNSIQQRTQKNQEDQQQVLAREQEALIEKLPEMGDPKKAGEAKASVARYLIDQGFSESDVQAASDHRLIVLARKAQLYDEGKERVDTAKKKVAKVPKVMKPSATKPQEEADKQKVTKARNRFKKTRSLDDAYQVLRARRTVGGQ